MEDQKPKYNIKAICNILGIQPGTLRAWERRYQIFDPIRNESGHRLYTEEHVTILRWLIDKVNKGFTIGQAVALFEKGNIAVTESQDLAKANDRIEMLTIQLEESLLNFQERKANVILDEAFSMFSIEKVVIEIIGKVLANIGTKWENGEIIIAHEHFATQYLRTRIGMIFQSLQVDPLLPKVVSVCAPNDRHELGLLIFTLFLRKKGYEVIYLGTGIPADDIQKVVEKVNAKYLFLSCTLVENLAGMIAVVEQMSEKKHLNIGVGGYALQSLPKKKKERYEKYIIGANIAEWEEWLHKMNQN